MKNAFRQSMAWMHTWVGLLLGWILFFMFLTGTCGYFDTEIDRWMRPEQPPVTTRLPVVQSVAVGLERLQAMAPNAQRWYVMPPVGRESPDLRVIWQSPADTNGKAQRGDELLDPRTGTPIVTRETGGGQVLYRMHYELHYLPESFTTWLVGLCTMFMFLALITGIVIHKKIFKDFFTFRPGKRQRSWLDAHNVLSVVSLPFHLMITYSGLIFFASTWMPLIISASYGTNDKNRQAFYEELTGRADMQRERSGISTPLTDLSPVIAMAEQRFGPGQIRYLEISNPGDATARIVVLRLAPGPLRSVERMTFDGASGTLLSIQNPIQNMPLAVRDVFLGLHEGLFAGPILRWLYFLAGLLGTAMIGTGLVLWTVKRREQESRRLAPSFGLALVERLNVGTIIGLPVGVLVYFWANRLLPVTWETRAAWEVHAMFIAWGLMLVHAHLRTPAQAWVEQFAMAAALALLLPLLNALTTQRHLGVTLVQGDWILAGFDLTLAALGLVFALTAVKVHAANKRTAPAKSPRRVLVLPPCTQQSEST